MNSKGPTGQVRPGHRDHLRPGGGSEIDLTREQFASHEVIQQPRVVPRPSELPKRAAEQYLTLKHRVLHALGLTEASDIR
jgi:hypothetical protein